MNLFRYLLSPKMAIAGLGVAVVGVLGLALVHQTPTQAATCDKANDIIECGYTTPTDLANKVQASSELQTLYNHAFTPGYGLGDLAAFKANAKHATVYKDGRVVLDDGTVLGTNANSIGRQKFNDARKPITIGGVTYYYSSTNDSFAANSLGAYVLVNDDHSLKFAALTACGNAVWATSPGYECKMLNKEKVSDTDYNFSVDTSTSGGATVTKVVIDFGDGQSKILTSNFTQKVPHTYAPGQYTARATVYFSANGQTKTDTRADCTKPVDVPQPPKKIFTCDSLSGTLIQNTVNQFTFTVKGSGTSVTLQEAKFDFGDGQTAEHLKTTDGKSVTTTHQYANANDYTVKAYLTFDAGATQETPNCIVKVTVAKTCANTPNAPECQPKTCENTPTLPGCQPQQPQQPQTLPSTGPAEIIGSALGLGSVTGAGLYYRNTRRNLISLILRR